VSAPKPQLLKPKLLASILHDPVRWRILRELCPGESLPVIELAMRARTKATKVSKHMAVLRKAGLVTTSYGRLYKLAPALKPDLTAQRLDLGHCVLKLDTEY
jgi:DNA-binding transcriptional ArsR family regulator